MKPRSKKTADLYRKMREARETFLLDNPCCCVCGWTATCVDEILRGKNRLRAFDQPCAWLPACGPCNTGPLADPGEWPVERKLARKLLIDPAHFDLDKVNELYAPKGATNVPERYSPKDVLRYLRDHLLENQNV